VKIGDVGYYRRPQGTFVRLFSAFDPVGTATSHGKHLPPLTGVQTGSQSTEKRNVLQRGFGWFGGILRPPKPKGSSAESSSGSNREGEVCRKYDFVLRSGHKRAMVVAESTIYVSLASCVLPEWIR